MRNVFSTAVIATALALLVPSNGAEAVRLVAAPDAMTPVKASLAADLSVQPVVAAVLAPMPAPDSAYAWMMAIGFLALVMVRRMRG